ncbi:hypothetical protein L873DRAFT_1073441 [Choiromyces venosus 120613-1]|uniref:Uncharacterized protein n=1 Tax=Choiromyces venosus 120613-1 TaxID=1336337 RepID=A0A3N4K386_9PEZI|nr:hypothetical protein L873DRAFT_1073441 [Choiromyces venosus 120613-1]
MLYICLIIKDYMIDTLTDFGCFRQHIRLVAYCSILLLSIIIYDQPFFTFSCLVMSIRLPLIALVVGCSHLIDVPVSCKKLSSYQPIMALLCSFFVYLSFVSDIAVSFPITCMLLFLDLTSF